VEADGDALKLRERISFRSDRELLEAVPV